LTLLRSYYEESLYPLQDFVNDTVPHFGALVSAPLFCRVDSVRNILSKRKAQKRLDAVLFLCQNNRRFQLAGWEPAPSWFG
jgi:hypothetical protein